MEFVGAPGTGRRIFIGDIEVYSDNIPVLREYGGSHVHVITRYPDRRAVIVIHGLISRVIIIGKDDISAFVLKCNFAPIFSNLYVVGDGAKGKGGIEVEGVTLGVGNLMREIGVN